VNDLLRSHHELRAAVRLASQKIVKLDFGRCAGPVLVFLRRTLREARTVAAHEQQNQKQAPGPSMPTRGPGGSSEYRRC